MEEQRFIHTRPWRPLDVVEVEQETERQVRDSEGQQALRYSGKGDLRVGDPDLPAPGLSSASFKTGSVSLPLQESYFLF